MITSPVDLARDTGNYLDNLDCEWHIKMPQHQKLILTFVKKFDIKLSKNCSSEFLNVRHTYEHFAFIYVLYII